MRTLAVLLAYFGLFAILLSATLVASGLGAAALTSVDRAHLTRLSVAS